VFVGLGAMILDPDYGWHVGMGKYILEYGIPKTDPFSYTMPSYPFVDHEWLMNILFYKGENLLGVKGMAIIFGIMAAASLYIGEKKRGWELGILLAAGILVLRMGVRPQVVDWILISIIWKIFGDENLWSKYRFWLIPGFVLWVNLHGGFAIGLGILGWIIVTKQLEVKKLRFSDLMVWFGSLMATFINPYGWRIWWEVWMQITDKELRGNIMEWQPFYTQVEPAFWFLALLWLFLVIKNKNKVWWKTTTVGVTLLAGLMSLRHAAIFAVLGGSELPRLLDKFWNDLKNTDMRQRAKQIYVLFLALVGVILIMAVSLQTIGFVRGGSKYPEKAILYLKMQKIKGNMFSEYAWGGYLIWKYPDQKVFIDGRMPSWRWKAPEGEAEMAINEYKKIFEEGEFRDIFTKYGVRTVLLPAAKSLTILDDINYKIEMVFKKWMKIEKEVVRKNLVEELIKDGWVKVYEDDIAIIYEK